MSFELQNHCVKISRCYWKIGEETGFWPKSESEQSQKPLSAIIRRRLTSLGQKVVEGLYRSSSPGTLDQFPWVVSCRHGDMERVVNLLSSLARKEMLSPINFSLSVHNAIIGLFSIAVKNRKNHVALSGAALSFEMGLVEAFALQKQKKETVGYIYYDRSLPHPYKGQIGNEISEVYFVLLLSEGDKDKKSMEFPSKSIYLTYERNELYSSKELNKYSSNISCLLGFLKADAKRCKISVPGGNFLLERVH